MRSFLRPRRIRLLPCCRHVPPPRLPCVIAPSIASTAKRRISTSSPIDAAITTRYPTPPSTPPPPPRVQQEALHPENELESEGEESGADYTNYRISYRRGLWVRIHYAQHEPGDYPRHVVFNIALHADASTIIESPLPEPSSLAPNTAVVTPYYTGRARPPRFPMVLADCMRALEFCRSQFLPEVRPTLYGSGASGGLALAIALTEGLHAVVVDPIVDWAAFGPCGWDSNIRRWTDLAEPGPWRDMRLAYFGERVERWVDPFASPMLFFKGPLFEIRTPRVVNPLWLPRSSWELWVLNKIRRRKRNKALNLQDVEEEVMAEIEELRYMGVVAPETPEIRVVEAETTTGVEEVVEVIDDDDKAEENELMPLVEDGEVYIPQPKRARATMTFKPRIEVGEIPPISIALRNPELHAQGKEFTLALKRANAIRYLHNSRWFDLIAEDDQLEAYEDNENVLRAISLESAARNEAIRIALSKVHTWEPPVFKAPEKEEHEEEHEDEEEEEEEEPVEDPDNEEEQEKDAKVALQREAEVTRALQEWVRRELHIAGESYTAGREEWLR